MRSRAGGRWSELFASHQLLATLEWCLHLCLQSTPQALLSTAGKCSSRSSILPSIEAWPAVRLHQTSGSLSASGSCRHTVALGCFGGSSQHGSLGTGHRGVRLQCSAVVFGQYRPGCLGQEEAGGGCWCLGRKKIKEVHGDCGLVIGVGKRTAKHVRCKWGCGVCRGSGHSVVAPALEGTGTVSKLPEKHFYGLVAGAWWLSMRFWCLNIWVLFRCFQEPLSLP